MSPIQAVSPSWDSVFATGTDGDEMDLSSSVADVDAKQWRSVQGEKTGSGAVVDSSNSAASREEIKEAMSRGPAMDMWSSEGYGHPFQTWPVGSGDNRASDEAMFDSLIQEDSFE